MKFSSGFLKLLAFCSIAFCFSSTALYSVKSITEEVMREYCGHTINQWSNPQRIKSNLPLEDLIKECVETAFPSWSDPNVNERKGTEIIQKKVSAFIEEIIATEKSHPDYVPFVHATIPVESFLSIIRQNFSEVVEGNKLLFPALRRLRATAQFSSINEFKNHGSESLKEEYKGRFYDEDSPQFDENECTNYVKGVYLLEDQLTKPVMISCNFSLFNNRISNNDITDNECTISYFKNPSNKTFYLTEEIKIYFKKLFFEEDISEKRLQKYVDLYQKYGENYWTGELYHLLVHKDQLCNFVRITKDHGYLFDENAPTDTNKDIEDAMKENFSTPDAQARVYLSSPGIDNGQLKIRGPYRVIKDEKIDKEMENELKKFIREDIEYAMHGTNPYEQHCPNKLHFRNILKQHQDDIRQRRDFVFQGEGKTWEASGFQIMSNKSLEKIIKLPLNYNTRENDDRWCEPQFHKGNYNKLVFRLKRTH